jgi:hypothetical protein
MIALNPRQKKEQSRAFVTECPLSDYDTLTREGRLMQLVQRINNSTDDDEQRRLKGYLPFRCPHYTRFRDNYRDREHIDPESFTWQTCVDIDDAEMVEEANRRSQQLDAEIGGEWQGMMLHKDYSARKKLHIDIRLPLGMTVPEAQRAYCKALGVPPDTSCFTPERFIYITPAEYEIYRADGWYAQLTEEEIAERRKAYTDRGLSIDGRDSSGSYYDTVNTERTQGPVTPVSSENSVRTFPNEFKGIPYTSIIGEYWHCTGGEPSEGERNRRLHQLATNLRAVCDNSEDWLLEIMPRYGLGAQEMRSIVHSACKEPTKGSKLMDQIVNSLKGGVLSDDVDDDEEDKVQSSKFQVQSNKLPIGLKESLSGVPVSMHMPVLCSVLPIAAAYADQVEVEYCDGMHQRLGLMSIIRGEQASGKSVCKNAVDVWKRQLDEEDALARKREEEWKERKKGRKANEKAPDDPKVLIRMVPVTVSCSTLLKRFKNSNGHTLYSFGEELDTLRKTNGAGSWSSKYDIYRLSFDRGEWGQDYNSDQAESGVVKVAYNWTMLGTDGAMHKCFKADNIENGLSSRIMVAEMPDSSFAKMPKFGRRSAEDEARIQEAVTRLRSYSGFVGTPRLCKAIETWVEEKRVEAAKDIDRVKDIYRKRAAVIGFRCGVVFHLLSGGNRESKACLDFALMMADYTLQQQIAVFGETLESQFIDARTECQRYGSNHSVYDQLPPSFTMGDLRSLKRGFCGESALRKIISRWYRDKWIEKTDKAHWKKVASDEE